MFVLFVLLMDNGQFFSNKVSVCSVKYTTDDYLKTLFTNDFPFSVINFARRDDVYVYKPAKI